MTTMPSRRKSAAYTLVALVTAATVAWILATLLSADPTKPTAIVPRGSHPETRSSEELGRNP